MSGGPPVTLCNIDVGVAGSWSIAGVILFAETGVNAARVNGRNPIRRVPAGGGVPVVATIVEPGDRSHTKPIFLPDGRHFLYSTVTRGSTMPIYVASLD